MFCQFCGKQIADAARFCPGCGNAVSAPQEAPAPAPAPVQAQTPVQPQAPAAGEVIDLTGTVELSAPQEGKNKALAAACWLMGLFFIAYAFLLKPWASFTGMGEGAEFGMYLLSAAIVTVPIAVIGLIITLVSKKKARLAVKMNKGSSVVIYLYTWVVCSLAVGCGYSVCFSVGGIVDFILAVMVVLFAISFIIFGNALAIQHGKEAVYSFLSAFFTSFIPAIFLGYLIAMILAAYIIFLIIVVVLFVVVFGSFFANGGVIVYKRN